MPDLPGVVTLMSSFFPTKCLNDREIMELNVQAVRSKIGTVSQEPVLFNRSIHENIAYGATDRTVEMNEIIAAAREANIHNFIETLPQVTILILLTPPLGKERRTN